MAISFISSARGPATYPSSTNNTSTCVISKPTGTAENDVMLVFLESGSAANFSYPSGWREVARYENSSANMTSTIAYKVATASEAASYSFGDSQDNGTPLCGMVLTYRGVDITDPINDPINARGESNTGTTGTTNVAAPTVTSTALGWYVWFRAGKISTTNPTENSFNVTGGTARQATSNRGASTEYFVQSADSNSSKVPGATTGATFARTGAGTFSGSLARTIVLKEAADPTTGTLDAQLGGLTVSTSGSVHDDGTISATLGKISVAAAGTHFPPAVGPLGLTLGGISAAFAGNTIGGSLDVSLSGVSVDFAGSVNPIGTFDLGLNGIRVEIGSETRVFGRNVILVEAEKRALQVTQYDTIPIYKFDVAFELLASPFEMTLGGIGISFAAETTSGQIELNLGGVAINSSGQIIFGGADLELAPVTVAFTGKLVGGSFAFPLQGVQVNALGFKWNPGDLSATLGAVDMLFTDNPVGTFDVDLGGIEIEAEGALVGGDFDGTQLGGITVAFDGVVTTEDIVKYATSIGDGTATSYTVTHSAGTRDVVVGVYDNSTYEEVVPLTVHATTNTVTVQFAAAPSSNAYRVVVLWSSV